MVLNIGILFNRLLNKFRNLLPIKDKDNQPTKVINNSEITNSTAGISKGR